MYKAKTSMNWSQSKHDILINIFKIDFKWTHYEPSLQNYYKKHQHVLNALSAYTVAKFLFSLLYHCKNLFTRL